MSPTTELLDAAKAFADAEAARNGYEAADPRTRGKEIDAEIAVAAARIRLQNAARNYGRTHSKRVENIDRAAALELSFRS